jgi:hypothetical protein
MWRHIFSIHTYNDLCNALNKWIWYKHFGEAQNDVEAMKSHGDNIKIDVEKLVRYEIEDKSIK